MQVSQIIENARKIFAQCPDAELLPRIGRAAFELSNMGRWDWTLVLQYLTLNCEQVCNQNGYVTLPKCVEMPISMTLDCQPAFPRNRWIQHHINGPGELTNINSYRQFWDDKAEVCTLRDMTGPSPLVAQNLNAADAGLLLRVYGLDDSGNEVYDDTGAPGINLSMNVPSSVVFSSVTQIYRPQGLGVITLTQTNDSNLIGYYYPDELDPRYRRVRIPKTCRTVTITYKRAIPQVLSLEDWLPLNNFNAMITALWYIFYIDKNDYENAEKARANALRSLREEESARTLATPVGPQIQNFSRQNCGDHLYGNRWGVGGY